MRMVLRSWSNKCTRMTDIISLSLVVLAVILAIPLATLLIQALATYLPERAEKKLSDAARPRAGVLIPAHNEAGGIAATIAGVKRQCREFDRIIVVADNCSDNTAAVAESAGAEVIIRQDLSRIGKGYALDAGFRHLTDTGAPDVVVILDADCQFGPSALEFLVRDCMQHQRPAQALYHMNLGSEDEGAKIARFAWRIKAVLRPIGFARLGLPCQLMGTGMAFPRGVLSACKLATGHITEDLVLGLETALQGRSARLCIHASVTSELPTSSNGRYSQRARWIHGYLAVLQEYTVKMFIAGIGRRDASVLALACDLAVPPLVLLILGCCASLGLSMLWYLAAGETAPLAINAIDTAMLMVFLGLAWAQYGRDLIGWREVTQVPRHMGSVAKIFLSYVAGRTSTWVRAERRG
jgi:cellulose synthase/poly-beta-1,6-N-acetylglucosamine synthase-like glycosyltransferase